MYYTYTVITDKNDDPNEAMVIAHGYMYTGEIIRVGIPHAMDDAIEITFSEDTLRNRQAEILKNFMDRGFRTVEIGDRVWPKG